jgi:hypothetical protein
MPDSAVLKIPLSGFMRDIQHDDPRKILVTKAKVC